MVYILYSPHTNNKNSPTYNQKGNDCWYYASKMIMRFFDATNENSYFRNELFLAAKKSRLDRDNYMKNDRAKLSSAFSHHFGKEVINQEGYYFKAGFKKIGKIFENYKSYTVDSLFSLLSEKGPLLASGQYGKPIHMMAPLRRHSFDVYPNLDSAGYRFKLSDYTGGNHAISIWGVSIEENCIFYSDPNYSFLDKILQVDFDLFKKNLDSLYYFDRPCTFANKIRPLAIFKEI